MAEESSAEVIADEGSAGTFDVNKLIAGKYRIIRLLGEGATGTVHLCEHTALERQVAVKVLHRDLANDAGLVERFQREARTAARLDHPNSVRVMDFGQDENGMLYLAMEYVPGRDLAELLNAEGPMSDERIVHIMSCVLSALSAAHALGVVHRDLKPENVLVCAASDGNPLDDIVKVCDFGIAQLSGSRRQERERELPAPVTSSETRRITGDGMVVGTCAYMSPEQARAQPLDERTDLYSAGVVLYQLLTRSLPFVAESAVAVAVMHCDTLPPPPSTHRPVNPALEAVCLQALSKTPEARYQSAAEMLAALQSALATPDGSRGFWQRATTSQSPMVVRSSIVPRQSFAPTELAGRTGTGATPELRRKRAGSMLLIAVSIAVPVSAAVPWLLPQQRHFAALETEDASDTALPSPQIPTTVAAATQVNLQKEVAARAASSASTSNRAHAGSSSPGPSAAVSTRPAARERRPPAVTRPRRPNAPAPNARESHNTTPASPDTASSRSDERATGAAVANHGAALDAPETELGAEVAAPVAVSQPVPHSESTATLAKQASMTAGLNNAAKPGTAGPSERPHAPSGPGRVSVQLDKVPGGVSRASLRAAINHAAISRCYEQGGAHTDGTASLEVATNMTGRIVSAHLSGASVPATVRSCVEQVARTGQIRDADVGPVHATFSVTLEH